MLFNSLDFALFLPIVFVLFWFGMGKNTKFQNILLIIASYIFYGWWDWKFLGLIILSTLIDFFIGLFLERKTLNRKILVSISIIVNLGLLATFKYFNFFLDNISGFITFFGTPISLRGLDIVLPVGISFYTFQTMSYTLDVYKGRLKATQDIFQFAAYVCFFPQLVAGPIERAERFLPQFLTKKKFDSNQAIEGLHLILWGLFKKIVIADSCAVYTNEIFEKHDSYNSITLLMGAIYFSFQIYGDFSGYSDIARGTAKLFGFELMENFKYPYFSRNIAEFWKRWHISLSTWFRDYLYIPLGGSRVSKYMAIRNVFIVFLVSGFWHGANWTFIAWGFFHALLFIPSFILNRNHKYDTITDTGYTFWEHISMFKTFLFVLIGWIIFRAKNINEAFEYIARMFSMEFAKGIEYLGIERYSIEIFLLVLAFLTLEWHAKYQEHPYFGKLKNPLLILTIISIVILGSFTDATDFIYFQF